MGSRGVDNAQPNPEPALIVIVEDDPLIRAVLADILADDGFMVREAQGADEALSALETQASATCVLFTDIIMPGSSIDGLDLIRSVHGRWPDIKLLVASGGSAPDPDDLPEGARFIPKPYRYHQLIRQVRDMTEAP